MVIRELFPYLRVKNAGKAIDFYKRAFGVTEKFRLTEPSGRIGHAELDFGGAILMLSDEYPELGFVGPETLGATTMSIHLHVDDCDAMIRRAVAEGATVVREPSDAFYGERSGTVRDPFGHEWMLGHEIEKVTPEEMQRRYDELMKDEEAGVRDEARGARGVRDDLGNPDGAHARSEQEDAQSIYPRRARGAPRSAPRPAGGQDRRRGARQLDLPGKRASRRSGGHRLFSRGRAPRLFSRGRAPQPGGGAAYGDGTREARLRFQELREVLLDDCGGVEQVIRALAYLRSKHPRRKRISEVLSYFRKHRKRMRYFEHKHFGLPVGSGPVEAACKILVAQRMKQSGMRWGMTGGQSILTVRGWTQSARFDRAWALLAATYQVQVTVIDNVIAFPIRRIPT